MLQKVGWKKDFILKSTPVLPISGWMGDNLTKKSDNMPWWKGMDIEVADQKKGTEKLHVRRLREAVACARLFCLVRAACSFSLRFAFAG